MKYVKIKDFSDSKYDKSAFFDLAPLLSIPQYFIIGQTTNCIFSMNNIVQLLCKSSESKPQPIKYSEFKTDINLNQIFQDQKEKTGHEIFQIYHPEPHHTYGIEKKWDGKNVIYRILHSWERYLSLEQWVGVKPWDSKSLNKLFVGISSIEKYAKKNLTVAEVKEFVHMFFNAAIYRTEAGKNNFMIDSVSCPTIQRHQVDEEKLKQLHAIVYIRPQINQYITMDSSVSLPFTLFDTGVIIEKNRPAKITAIEKFFSNLIFSTCALHCYADFTPDEIGLLLDKDGPLKAIVDDFIANGGLLPNNCKKTVGAFNSYT